MKLKSKTKVAANRKELERRIKTPDYIKKILIKAIKLLTTDTGRVPTYREIQEKAFELYQKEVQKSSFVQRLVQL